MKETDMPLDAGERLNEILASARRADVGETTEKLADPRKEHNWLLRVSDVLNATINDLLVLQRKVGFDSDTYDACRVAQLYMEAADDVVRYRMQELVALLPNPFANRIVSNDATDAGTGGVGGELVAGVSPDA